MDGDLRKIKQNRETLERNAELLRRETERLRNREQQRDKQIFNGVGREHLQLHRWVNSQRYELKGDVFGPIVRHMKVTDRLMARFLNNAISKSTFYVTFLFCFSIFFSV